MRLSFKTSIDKMAKRAAKTQKHKSVNPIIKFFNNVIFEGDVFSYTSHNDWDKLVADSEAMSVFETWYNSNNSDYRHIKHAFNSLCKHYGLIKITNHAFIISGEDVANFWTFKSFYDEADNKSQSWVYQVLDGEYHLVATKDEKKSIEIINMELLPFKFLIDQCM